MSEKETDAIRQDLKDLRDRLSLAIEAIARVEAQLGERCENRACEIEKIKVELKGLRDDHSRLRSRVVWLMGAIAATVALLKDYVKELLY
jgi:chromosome segregation ATPase